MSEFCGVNCFGHELSAELDKDGQLPADIRIELESKLPVDKYTRLTLCGPFGCEIIRVVNKEGEVCISGRGEEGTTIECWPKGSSIKFQWTNQNMADFWQCQNTESNTEEELGIKSEYFDVTRDPETGKICIEPPEEEKDQYGTKSFKAGNFLWTLTNGTWCRVPLPANETTPDGTYPCATVIMKDGCPTYRKGETLNSKCQCSCGSCGGDCEAMIEPACQATAPATDGSEGYFWYNAEAACSFMLVKGVWVGL